MDARYPERHQMCQSSDVMTTEKIGASDMKITTIGIDLAKEVFQIHGVNEHDKVMPLKQLRRNA
jgi:hypothetical protein